MREREEVLSVYIHPPSTGTVVESVEHVGIYIFLFIPNQPHSRHHREQSLGAIP